MSTKTIFVTDSGNLLAFPVVGSQQNMFLHVLFPKVENSAPNVFVAFYL